MFHPSDRTLLIALLAVTCVSASAAQAKPANNAAPATSETTAQLEGIDANIAGNLFQRGDAYFDQGDYPRTVALDRIIVVADPGFLECYATGGWLMESLGRLKDAEAFYQDGIAKNPNSSYMEYSLGMFYFNTLKDYPSAVAVFQADARDPGSSDIDWKMLAHSYERIGQYQDAVAVWTEIKKRWPASPAVQYNLNKDLARVSAAHAAGS
jgi:tetratricopeptide (TPR) repeat protein